MNEDVLKGKWKQLRGEVRNWWGKLTEDDILRIEGSSEKLSGILQERYGYTWQAAQDQIADFMEEMEERFQIRSDR